MTVAKQLKSDIQTAFAQAWRVSSKDYGVVIVHECVFIDGSRLTIREYLE